MCLLLDEPGAEAVQEQVEGENHVLLPFMALMEIEYVLRRLLSEPELERTIATLRAWPVEIPESTPEWGREAARVKSRGGLSLGDAWIASLALLRNGRLVHKDPEFDGVESLQALKLN